MATPLGNTTSRRDPPERATTGLAEAQADKICTHMTERLMKIEAAKEASSYEDYDYSVEALFYSALQTTGRRPAHQGGGARRLTNLAKQMQDIKARNASQAECLAFLEAEENADVFDAMLDIMDAARDHDVQEATRRAEIDYVKAVARVFHGLDG